MKFVEISRERSQLLREEWRFWYSDRDHALVLHSYAKLERPTARHKHRPSATYDSHYSRHNTVGDPPLPEDVADDARAQFYSALRVLATQPR